MATLDNSSVMWPEKPGSMKPAVACVINPSRPNDDLPSSRLASLGVGIVGGLGSHLLGGLLWSEAPRVGGLHIPLAMVGAALFIVLLGLAPFLRILLGKTPY